GERGRHSDARDHLLVLLEAAPDDAELEGLLGRCEEAGAHFARAAEWYERAARHAPARLEHHAGLARLYRHRLDQPDRADAALKRMVEANDRDFRARLLRARYWIELGSAVPHPL